MYNHNTGKQAPHARPGGAFAGASWRAIRHIERAPPTSHACSAPSTTMPNRRRHPLTGHGLTGVSTWMLLGCASGDATVPTSLVRDSADITIVENAMPALDSRMAWRVASEPTLSIGTLDGDGPEQLFFVMDAARLADGSILVANSGTSEVRRFSTDGNHLGTWGGVGEGPG